MMVVALPSGTIAVGSHGPPGRSFSRNSPAPGGPGPVWPVKPFTLMVGPVGPVKPTRRVLPISAGLVGPVRPVRPVKPITPIAAGPVGPVRPFTPSMAILGAQVSKRSRRRELLAGGFYSWDKYLGRGCLRDSMTAPALDERGRSLFRIRVERGRRCRM